MRNIPLTDIQDYTKELATYDFIVVGEMHGSKQNAPVLQELISRILADQKSVTVAFEWVLSPNELSLLQSYINGGAVPTHIPAFFLDSDGRVTLEHIALLKWIREKNRSNHTKIGIYTFDDGNPSDDYDKSMANSLSAYKKVNPAHVMIVATGNIHARNTAYMFDTAEYTPMASLLKRNYSVFSLFLKYLKGEIEVEGTARDVTMASSQQQNPETYFDATIEIPLSEASQKPSDLTQIIRML